MNATGSSWLDQGPVRVDRLERICDTLLSNQIQVGLCWACEGGTLGDRVGTIYPSATALQQSPLQCSVSLTSVP